MAGASRRRRCASRPTARVDELGAVLGLARTHPLPGRASTRGSGASRTTSSTSAPTSACPRTSARIASRRASAPGCASTPEQVAWLEARCDEVNDTLPPLTSFVLAGGTPGRRGAAPRAHGLPARRARDRRAGRPPRPSAPTRCSTSTGSPICSSCSPARRIRRAGRCSGFREGRGADGDRHEREALHETLSGIPVEPLYSPGFDAARLRRARSATRASYPYTRGVYGSMHRGRLWTMRMFAGFGTADETNERFRYLLEQGQTGLSTAFDMPTLMGYDSDAAAGARRGRPRGRRDRHAGRHRGSLRGHPARPGHGVDDGQRAGGDGARDVRLHGAAARHPARAPSAARSRRTSSRSSSPRRSGSSRPSRPCGSSST